MTSRREFLKKTALIGASAITFPAILHARNKYPTIKIVGTHVTLLEPIRQRAQKELGINVEFYPGGSAEIIFKATTNPESFDLYEQ